MPRPHTDRHLSASRCGSSRWTQWFRLPLGSSFTDPVTLDCPAETMQVRFNTRARRRYLAAQRYFLTHLHSFVRCSLSFLSQTSYCDYTLLDLHVSRRDYSLWLGSFYSYFVPTDSFIQVLVQWMPNHSQVLQCVETVGKFSYTTSCLVVYWFPYCLDCPLKLCKLDSTLGDVSTPRDHAQRYALLFILYCVTHILFTDFVCTVTMQLWIHAPGLWPSVYFEVCIYGLLFTLFVDCLLLYLDG
jgi:hypothetical protein